MTSDRPGAPAARLETDPGAEDRRLRGRTYAIPFERVWTAALALADGGAGRWAVQRADDEDGVIEARFTTLVFRSHDDVRVDVGLDENGQTRVDLAWTTASRRPALGRGRRVVGDFVRKLDAALEAAPEEILDASRTPTWTA